MIYTSICGGIDSPRDDIKVMDGYSWFVHPRMIAKQFKILSHLYFEETTLWVDGNIFPVVHEKQLLNDILGDCDVGVFRHPYRRNVLEELNTVYQCGFDDPIRLLTFKSHFGEKKLAGLPLFECSIVARRNTELVRQINERWWALICRWSWRDQLTFPMAVSGTGVKLNAVPMDLRKYPGIRRVNHL